MACVYLLDTNICIYIARRRPPGVLQRFETLPVGSVAMSLITYGELHFGAGKSRDREKTLEKLIRLSELVPIRPLPLESAHHYARIRAKLERTGTPIGANDLWIASHALSESLTLVSNNIGEFRRIAGLKLENWIA